MPPPASYAIARSRPAGRLGRRSLAAMSGLVLAVGGLLASPAPSGAQSGSALSGTAGTTIALAPSQDTYVVSTNTAANYGSATQLRATSSAYRAFLRFATSGLVPPGDVVTNAALRLYVTNDDVQTGGFEVHPEPDTWTESGTTWGNQPSWDTTVLATSDTPTTGSWLSIDLPVSAVDNEGNTSFGVRYTVPFSSAKFASREDPAHAPQLLIQRAPADPNAVSLPATADTFVNLNAVDTNYGTANPLAASPQTKRALLRFATAAAVPAGSALDSATLEVFVTTADTSGSGFEVHPEADTWSETGVTWNNQPTWDKTVLAASGAPPSGGWLSIPLPTSAVNGSGETSFGLRYTVAGSNAYFSSREDPVNAPQLVLSWTPGPTVTSGSATNLSATTATVSGTVNPNGSPTSCRFEYGTTTDYGLSTAEDATPGSGSAPTALLADLAGLTPATTYHFRLTCTNAAGTATGADGSFSTSPADLLQQEGLIYGTEIGGWLPGGSPAVDAGSGVPAKVIAAGVPVIRYEAKDCFTDETCGGDRHPGTLLRSDFDHAINGITATMHAVPYLKLLPVSKAGSTFCPDKNADLSLANPTMNLPIYESMLAEIANGAGYTGPIIIESSNEMDYDCAAHWFGANTSAGYPGVSALMGQYFAATMPDLVKYARDDLHFSQVVSVGYLGVSGGGYGNLVNGWGANCTADPTAAYGYACGYRARAITEFNNALLAAYNAHNQDPDYLPDAESIHAYCHSTDFMPAGFTAAPYDFDNNVCFAFYRSWIVNSRAYLNAIWGPAIGNDIRFSISEWEAGACASSTNCWTGFSDPAAVSAYYAGWYRMLRGDGNTTGTGTRYWSANQFGVASFADTAPNGVYNLVRQDGTTPAWYDTFKALSSTDPLR